MAAPQLHVFLHGVRCALVLGLVAAPGGAQSLKTLPSTEELLRLLRDPAHAIGERVRYPGLAPLPSLEVHRLTTNTLTGQPLRMDAPPRGISYDVPARGTTPFVNGQPDRPLDVPTNEYDFVVDRQAAARLGKALFWDMQLGSDGVQACGSCHFHAGADARTRNQVNPGVNAGDGVLELVVKNGELTPDDFPLHRLADPNRPGEPLLHPDNVLYDTNDVVSSMGVRWRVFTDIPTPGPGAFVPGTDPPVLAPDLGVEQPDPVGPAFDGVRRVEPRNTPTFFAASSNYDNFWDGRGRHDFNGGSPHGASDPQAHVFEDEAGSLVGTRPLIRFSSFASLATGPALSNNEMSFDGRTWPKIGKKLLQDGVVPLANQLVDPTDSVLGPLSNQNLVPGMPGLSVSYPELIRAAFAGRLWSNAAEHLEQVPDPLDPFDGASLLVAGGPSAPTDTNQFTQMEANFSLFFGLATQAYTQLLQPDDTPFDRFHDANPDEFLGIVHDIDPGSPGLQVAGLSERQLLGYDFFQNTNLSGKNPEERGGNCNICHVGPTLTENALVNVHGVYVPDPATGEDRVVSGFLLEELLNGNAQRAVELDNTAQHLDGFSEPGGIALVDRGIYNIGVRPIAEDLGRGADDAFGFPLSLATLSLWNEGHPVGRLGDPATPERRLPEHLRPFLNALAPGARFPAFETPAFVPDRVAHDAHLRDHSGTFPTPNRVSRMGSFKVPSLRNVELTGPYMHNGGMLTLRQVVDFYSRGGDFPVTNAAHRDPQIRDLHAEFGTFLTSEDKAALVDFLLALTDERVRWRRAPFDHPEILVPIDGTAPDNVRGRGGLLADPRFLHVAAVGASGADAPLRGFLGVSAVEGDAGPDHFDAITGEPAGLPLVFERITPGAAGFVNRFTLRHAEPGHPLGILVGRSLGPTELTTGTCNGLLIDLAPPYSVPLIGVPDEAGTITFEVTVPATLVGVTAYLQAVQPGSCEVSNLMTETF